MPDQAFRLPPPELDPFSPEVTGESVLPALSYPGAPARPTMPSTSSANAAARAEVRAHYAESVVEDQYTAALRPYTGTRPVSNPPIPTVAAPPPAPTHYRHPGTPLNATERAWLAAHPDAPFSSSPPGECREVAHSAFAGDPLTYADTGRPLQPGDEPCTPEPARPRPPIVHRSTTSEGPAATVANAVVVPIPRPALSTTDRFDNPQTVARTQQQQEDTVARRQETPPPNPVVRAVQRATTPPAQPRYPSTDSAISNRHPAEPQICPVRPPALAPAR